MKADNLPTFVMMVGIPGSGKSTAAKMLLENLSAEAPWVIHSSDAIRQELFGDEGDQKHNSKVFTVMKARTVKDLLSGVSVIYDATNITAGNRTRILQSLPPCHMACVYVDTPVDVCIKQNNARSRVVPEYAIRRMAKQLEAPVMEEGWEMILTYHFDEHKAWLETIRT